MNPHHWQKIEQLYHAALERGPEDRAAFLAESCAGDQTLRQEVESLLAYEERTVHFITSPPDEVAAEMLAAEQSSPLGKSFGHYRILALLGKGGMGEVYQARDAQLDRTVALKLLPAQVAADRERMQRFHREAKAASALNHPHVATIYEIGVADGVSFIAMEYVEGQSLAAKINGHPLMVKEIVEFGSQIADALDEAHNKGITHRDIKPANVMLTLRGQVKVLDFGLAKIARPQSIDSNISTLAQTEPGVMMGTVPYMSPEQALGREVDHRSDIFSLGVVLYEMATGRLPFAGASTSETLDRILHAQPEAMARFNYDVPAELERIVRKCLEKERERRYQSVRELLVDLRNLKRDGQSVTMAAPQIASQSPSHGRRRFLIAVAVTLLALGGLVFYLLRPDAPTKGQAINSIAVLPFRPLVTENRDEALELGMADTLITRLSSIRQLIVRPVSAVRKYASVEQNAIAAGREQQVDAVLESHFQRSGDRIRVTARLIRVVDGSTVWAGKFDEQSADPLAVQDGMSEQVARALAPQLTGVERKRLAKRETENAEAYLFYQKGRFFQSKRTGEALKKSVEYFNQAIEKDPNFALAYGGLADAYLGLPAYGVGSHRDSLPKSKAAAKRSLELDETLAEAHVSMANSLFHEFNFQESNREFQRAIELNPNYAPAYQGYGRRNLLVMKQFDEAIASLKRAHELDPLSLVLSADLGVCYFFAGQYDKAIEQLLKTNEMDQNFYNVHRYLGWAYEMKGSFQQALAEYQKAIQLNDDPVMLAWIGYTYAAAGRRGEALRKLDQLKALSRQRYVSEYNFAIIYAGLDEKDQVFQWLDRAYQNQVPDPVQLTIDPRFANLRSDPRFAALVRRIGLTP